MNVIQNLPPKVSSTSDCAIDFEVFGQQKTRLHRPEGTFASCQICIGKDVYIVLDVKDVQKVWDRIKHARHIIMHNALYDLRQLRRWAKFERRPIWDSMVVDKCLWGGYFNTREFSLADLCRRYLDVYLEKDTREQFSTLTSMSDETIEYAARDAYFTFKVKQAQDEEIESRSYDMHTYWEIEEPTIWSTLDFHPMKVNVKRWLEMAQEFNQRGLHMQDKLGINVMSPIQVQKFIKKELHKDINSTGEAVLKELGGDLVEKILTIRQLRKASSTYGEKWIEKYVEANDLVYPDLYTIGTETGRGASVNPNLYNIPARRIPEYRELFISRNGKLIVADISAQEPRILCALSGDPKLLEIFQVGQDIHLMVARAVFNDDTIKKSDKRREVGKVINLATSYGMTSIGLSKKLGISEMEASKFLNSYFARFTKVYEYKQTQQDFANRFGYVESITGRRIWINPYSYQWANNTINAPIQSSAADFTKMWLNKLFTKCRECDKMYPVCITVYDEIVADVSKQDKDIYVELITQSFNETAQELFPHVPFEVDLKVGNNWGCKRLDKEEKE